MTLILMTLKKFTSKFQAESRMDKLMSLHYQMNSWSLKVHFFAVSGATSCGFGASCTLVCRPAKSGGYIVAAAQKAMSLLRAMTVLVSGCSSCGLQQPMDGL